MLSRYSDSVMGFLELGGVEQQQVLQQALLRAEGVVDGEFEAVAKLAEEVLVLLALVFEQLFQLGLDLLFDAVLDGLELAVVLQQSHARC